MEESEDINIRLLAGLYDGSLDAPMVKELLEDGADPNYQGKVPAVSYWETTPLINACCVKTKEADLAIIKTLVEHGADPNLQNKRGEMSPLWIAASYNRVEAVQTLLELGADANLEIKKDNEPFPLCCCFRDTEGQDFSKLLEVLLEGGAKPNVFSLDGVSPLLTATHCTDLKRLDSLLKRGGDPSLYRLKPSRYEHQKRHNAFTYLAEKDYNGEAGEAMALLSMYGDINAQNELGWPALYYAFHPDKNALFESILALGGNPNFLHRDQQSLLHCAIGYYRANPLIFERLMGIDGIDLNFDKKTTLTPLQYAIEQNVLPAFVALFEAGAKPTLKNPEGMDALQFAKKEARVFFIAYMLRRPPEPMPLLIEVKESFRAGFSLETAKGELSCRPMEPNYSNFLKTKDERNSMKIKTLNEQAFSELLIEWILDTETQAQMVQHINAFRKLIHLPALSVEELIGKLKKENAKDYYVATFEAGPSDYADMLIMAMQQGVKFEYGNKEGVNTLYIEDHSYFETYQDHFSDHGSANQYTSEEIHNRLVEHFTPKENGEFGSSSLLQSGYRSALHHFKVETVKEWLLKLEQGLFSSK